MLEIAFVLVVGSFFFRVWWQNHPEKFRGFQRGSGSDLDTALATPSRTRRKIAGFLR